MLSWHRQSLAGHEMIFLWACTIASTVIAAILLVVSFFVESAILEAALAATAAALVVIPYVFTRAVEAVVQRPSVRPSDVMIAVDRDPQTLSGKQAQRISEGWSALLVADPQDPKSYIVCTPGGRIGAVAAQSIGEAKFALLIRSPMPGRIVRPSQTRVWLRLRY